MLYRPSPGCSGPHPRRRTVGPLFVMRVRPNLSLESSWLLTPALYICFAYTYIIFSPHTPRLRWKGDHPCGLFGLRARWHGACASMCLQASPIDSSFVPLCMALGHDSRPAPFFSGGQVRCWWASSPAVYHCLPCMPLTMAPLVATVTFHSLAPHGVCRRQVRLGRAGGVYRPRPSSAERDSA